MHKRNRVSTEEVHVAAKRRVAVKDVLLLFKVYSPNSKVKYLGGECTVQYTSVFSGLMNAFTGLLNISSRNSN